MLPSDWTGPWLQAAVFCEKVLNEQDGVLSAIRIVDRINVAGGHGAPETMPPVTINLFAFLAFKAGSARGSATIRLRQEDPSGLRAPPLLFQALFEGEDRGVNLVFNVNFEVRLEGLHWFDVLVGDVLVTRMPLRVVYQRVTFGGFGAPGPPPGPAA
jgi:hypothetical protein